MQRVLVEAAKLAPRQNHDLALVYEREKQKGNRNRATLAVARKMVAYLLAVDRRRTRVCTRRECQRHSGLKPPGRKRLQDYSARRLPGPAVCRLSEGDQTPEAPFELFRDWQRTQTQSSVTALQGPETVNGCLVLRRQEPLPRGTVASCEILKMSVLARSSVARVRRTVFSLDKDLHGSRSAVGPILRFDFVSVGVSQVCHPTPCVPTQGPQQMKGYGSWPTSFAVLSH